jgi:hypothetical protein
MGFEPKRPGNLGIVMVWLQEVNGPLRHPLLPRIHPWIYPTGFQVGERRRSRVTTGIDKGRDFAERADRASSAKSAREQRRCSCRTAKSNAIPLAS